MCRFARGGAQDLVLAFGDGAAFFVHPGEGVVAIGGADINHDAGGGLRAGGASGLAGMADSALVEKMTPGRSGMVFFSDGSVSQAFFQIW